jgi:hypothetical protein
MNQLFSILRMQPRRSEILPRTLTEGSISLIQWIRIMIDFMIIYPAARVMSAHILSRLLLVGPKIIELPTIGVSEYRHCHEEIRKSYSFKLPSNIATKEP